MPPDRHVADGAYDQELDAAVDGLLADCAELAARLSESLSMLREVVEERRAWKHAPPAADGDGSSARRDGHVVLKAESAAVRGQSMQAKRRAAQLREEAGDRLRDMARRDGDAADGAGRDRDR
jgi:hypothetical protein